MNKKINGNVIFHYDIIQNTEVWDNIRLGKMTASHATAIKANGAGLATYSKKIARNIIGIKDESFTNKDIERGNELEPEALLLYSLSNGVEVETCGFIENSLYPNIGCSPDGLIKGVKAGIEIKARNNEKHFDLIQGATKDIPYDQIQMSLLISEYEYWDFVSYNPNFVKNPLFVKRIYPDLEVFKKLQEGFIKGKNLINKALNTYNEYR